MICELLAAVTLPSSLNDGFSDGQLLERRLADALVGGHRACPRRRAPGGSGARSGPRRGPGRRSCCERRPKASISSRLMPHLSAIISAEMPCGTRPPTRLVAGADLGPEREAVLAVGHRGAHRHPGHHLDAGRHHHVVGAGDHALGGEVGGLLATSRTGGRRSCRAPSRASRRRARRCGRCSRPARRPASRSPSRRRRRGPGRCRCGRSAPSASRPRGRRGASPSAGRCGLPERRADGIDDDGGRHGELLILGGGP